MHGPSPSAADDRRERFRAQAGAIVAVERGLTPACRIKLANLAHQLGLDEAESQEVLRSFAGSAPPAQSPAAKKFQRDVRKTLSSLSIAALTPLHESRLVEVARKKHALSEHEAEAIIAATAAELGVGRISSDEACATLDGMIADKLGSDEWLDGDSRETLYKAGERWGLSKDDVDALVQNRLETNRQQRKQKQWLQKGAIGGVAAVVVAASLFLMYLLNRGDTSGETAVSPGELNPSEAPEKPRRSAAPAWWTTDLAIDVAALKRSEGELAKLTTALAADDPAKRRATYERLAQIAIDPNTNDADRRLVVSLLGQLYALDPEEFAVAGLRDAVLAAIPAPDAPLPDDPQAIERTREAAQLPARLLEAKELKGERRVALVEALQRALGMTLNVEAPALERIQQVRAAVITRLYRQLIHAARRDSERPAVAFPVVDSYARQDLPFADAERLEGEFLAAWLPAAGENWTRLKDKLVYYVNSCQTSNLFRLLDVYQRSSTTSLTEQLGRLLLVRVGAAAPANDKKLVLSTLRQALGVSAQRSSATAGERWQRLADRADELFAASKPAADDVRGQLGQALQAAWLTNLAVMLVQGEAYFTQFDKALEEEPELPTSVTQASEEGTPSPKSPSRTPRKAPPRTAMPAQTEMLVRYVEVLHKFEQHPPAQRVTAVRGLGILAASVPDISPDQAASIARYLLASKPDEEHSQLETALTPLRSWRYLRLAVADGLQASRLKAEQLGMVVRSLLSHGGADTSDRAALKRAMLQDVLESLGDVEAPAERQSDRERLPTLFDDVAGRMLDLYRERLRTLGAANEELAGADSASRALGKCVERVQSEGRKGTDKGAQQWQEQLVVADYIAENDLRRTVYIQGLWLQASAARLAKRNPSQRSAATTVQAEGMTVQEAHSQLRERELAALKLWLLNRTE